MATERSVGYVVTASIWNAVLSRLTDDGATFSGAFNGTSVAGTTGSFSSTLAVTGAVTLSSTLAVSGVTTITAADTRGLRITRTGGSAGMWIASSGGSGKSYYLQSDTSGVFTIGDNDDNSPKIEFNANDINIASADNIALSATNGVTNANYYHSATEQPGFFAYNLNDDTGLTTTTTVEFDTEVFDTGADFNTTTDTFTAPKTGIYHFVGSVYVINRAASEKAITVTLVHSSGPTTWYVGTAWLAQDKGTNFPFSIYLSLTASDTVLVQATSGGGSNDFDIQGGLTTWFGGRLVA